MLKQASELECPFCGTSHDHEKYASKPPPEKVDRSGGAHGRRRACSSTGKGLFVSVNGASAISRGGADAYPLLAIAMLWAPVAPVSNQGKLVTRNRW